MQPLTAKKKNGHKSAEKRPSGLPAARWPLPAVRAPQGVQTALRWKGLRVLLRQVNHRFRPVGHQRYQRYKAS